MAMKQEWINNKGIPRERIMLRVCRDFDRLREENRRMRTILQALKLSDLDYLREKVRNQAGMIKTLLAQNKRLKGENEWLRL